MHAFCINLSGSVVPASGFAAYRMCMADDFASVSIQALQIAFGLLFLLSIGHLTCKACIKEGRQVGDVLPGLLLMIFSGLICF